MGITISEAVKELNEMFKDTEIKRLENKVDTLEKIIINLINRLEYLETRCQ